MAETVPDATGTVLQLWAALLACVVLRVCRWLAATCWVAALSLMLSAALIEGRRGAKGRGGAGDAAATTAPDTGKGRKVARGP